LEGIKPNAQAEELALVVNLAELFKEPGRKADVLMECEVNTVFLVK
jgi:hypothetical protein